MNKWFGAGILILWVAFLSIDVTATNPTDEGKAFARQLHDKGYADKSIDLNAMKQGCGKKPENQHLESQSCDLSSMFEAQYDSGKKDEDPLKTHFARKNIETSKNKHPNQPSLGDAELLLKDKHRFQVSTDDALFRKHQEISQNAINNQASVFQKGTSPKQANTKLTSALDDKILTCRKGVPGEKKECTKKRIVRLVDGPTINKTISVSASGATMHTVYLTVDLIQGTAVFSTNTPWRMVGYPRLPLNGRMPYGSATVSPLLSVNRNSLMTVSFSGISNQSEPRASYFVLQHPSALNNFVAKISFKFNPTWHAEEAMLHPMSAAYTWVFTESTKVLQETWEGCENLERQQIEQTCEEVFSEQQDINATRKISGYAQPITRSHWAENKEFLCGGGRDIDECEPLLQQKCEQIDSRCAVLKDKVCIEHENTFRCNVPDYQKSDGLSFNQGTLSFLSGKGETTTEDYGAADFAEAVTDFSALTEMGKKMEDGLGGIMGDPNNPSVFKGECRQCRVNFGSFVRDCCKLKGVLQGLLGKCNTEEQKLAVAAVKNKRCVKINGRYCHKKIAKICVEKRDSYCCYGSELARILQEIAHFQLGISWGDAKHPNCSSLTAAQLSQVNFDTPYAQQKLSEILGEVQATAQDKFNRVQQAVAAAKSLQVRAQDWEKKQAEIESLSKRRVEKQKQLSGSMGIKQ